MIPDFIIRKKIFEYLEEDLYYGDAMPIEDKKVKAMIISKDNGVIAGIRVAKIAFESFGVKVLSVVKDGDYIGKGDIIMEVVGSSANILMLERTILNILMRMSGIATATAEMVKIAKSVNPKVKIAATRKTTPGFRIFEKMAVEIGGGDPHRFGLGDCVIVKDNHIAVAGDLVKAIRLAKSTSFTKKIEVEVKSIEEALIAVKEDVDIIMLDNFKVKEVEEVINLLEKEKLRNKILIEVSGGITPKNVKDYAKTGVDIISSGYITHSARALDLSLEVEKIYHSSY
ncbi:MAG TPA: carboxylating nicotinate-nucleotide diphosphorylase [Archaeoglobus profundus]|nr:carboxylating nicotinate-nucleotide diphosphorylase [Archaeoglobus profundus]HIP58552.1 carboxylating nicotinate-nucleotide diphosphorylase [Archaeoglobus profundus]